MNGWLAIRFGRVVTLAFKGIFRNLWKPTTAADLRYSTNCLQEEWTVYGDRVDLQHNHRFKYTLHHLWASLLFPSMKTIAKLSSQVEKF